MKKNSFLLVVLINSAALIGIIITQYFWIRNAFNLLEEDFAASVRIAVKSVASQIPAGDVQLISANISQVEYRIGEEFKILRLDEEFHFAILDNRNNSILGGKYGHYDRQILTSAHKIPIPGTGDEYSLAVFFPQENNHIISKLTGWIAIWIIFTLVLIIGFPVSIFIFNRQKKLSGMKTDFINNMTHEFKTPIATISLAGEMLLNEKVLEDKRKIEKYARVILDENTRLQNHVEQILSVSQLERGQFRLKKKELDVHQLIAEVVKTFSLSFNESGGTIKTHYCANRFIIKADKEHLTNVIFNLLDNAKKYSKENPWIRIGTQNVSNGLVISVEDKGIGISPENQRHIFRNLYRVPTGNLHKVKGFGIGLFYVKTIVEAHGGHINLTSELNKGSRFDLFLPFVYNLNKEDEYTQT